jgi:hypothetical protein
MKINLYDDDGNVIKLPMQRIVCPRCHGDGKHTNPNVDGNGLDPNDPDLDEEFWENYKGGLYDVTCEECGGRNVIDEVDVDVLEATDPELFKQWCEAVDDYYDDIATRRAESGYSW